MAASFYHGAMVLVACAIPALLCLTMVQGQPPSEDPLPEDVRAVVPRLKELMKAGLRQDTPSANIIKREGGETLFSGSYDWHSNLFAYFALLTMARVEGDSELAAWLLEPLTPEALRSEGERVFNMDRSRHATFPYDEGWFLLMLSELERHLDPRDDEAGSLTVADVRALRVGLEERILEHLEAERFPELDPATRKDGRRFVGFYRSWLFAWYQLRLSHPVGEGHLARLQELKNERVAGELEHLAASTKPHPYNFLWVPILGHLVHDVDPFDQAPAPYDLGEFDELPPFPEAVKLSTVHVLGVEISRLWPLAIQAHRGDKAASEAFSKRWRELIAREDLWAEDFEVVTHWVPQFLWFATWLADGRP